MSLLYISIPLKSVLSATQVSARLALKGQSHLALSHEVHQYGPTLNTESYWRGCQTPHKIWMQSHFNSSSGDLFVYLWQELEQTRELCDSFWTATLMEMWEAINQIPGISTQELYRGFFQSIKNKHIKLTLCILPCWNVSVKMYATYRIPESVLKQTKDLK